MSSRLWRARQARISWAAVTVQTWLTAVCRSISRRRDAQWCRILRLGSCSFVFVRATSASRLICRADNGLAFRRSFVCRNQERGTPAWETVCCCTVTNGFHNVTCVLGVQWPRRCLQEPSHYSTSRRGTLETLTDKSRHSAYCCCVINLEKAVMIFTFRKVTEPILPHRNVIQNFSL